MSLRLLSISLCLLLGAGCVFLARWVPAACLLGLALVLTWWLVVTITGLDRHQSEPVREPQPPSA